MRRPRQLDADAVASWRADNSTSERAWELKRGLDLAAAFAMLVLDFHYELRSLRAIRALNTRVPPLTTALRSSGGFKKRIQSDQTYACEPV